MSKTLKAVVALITSVACMLAPLPAQAFEGVDVFEPPQPLKNALVRVVSSKGICTGTLVAPNVITTASHCFFDGVTRYSVSAVYGDSVTATVVEHRSFGADFTIAKLNQPIDREPIPVASGYWVPVGSELLSCGGGVDYLRRIRCMDGVEVGPSSRYFPFFQLGDHLGEAELIGHSNPGDSGGPVMNDAGELVGVITGSWVTQEHADAVTHPLLWARNPLTIQSILDEMTGVGTAAPASEEPATKVAPEDIPTAPGAPETYVPVTDADASKYPTDTFMYQLWKREQDSIAARKAEAETPGFELLEPYSRIIYYRGYLTRVYCVPKEVFGLLSDPAIGHEFRRESLQNRYFRCDAYWARKLLQSEVERAKAERVYQAEKALWDAEHATTETSTEESTTTEESTSTEPATSEELTTSTSATTSEESTTEEATSEETTSEETTSEESTSEESTSESSTSDSTTSDSSTSATSVAEPSTSESILSSVEPTTEQTTATSVGPTTTTTSKVVVSTSAPMTTPTSKTTSVIATATSTRASSTPATATSTTSATSTPGTSRFVITAPTKTTATSTTSAGTTVRSTAARQPNLLDATEPPVSTVQQPNDIGGSGASGSSSGSSDSSSGSSTGSAEGSSVGIWGLLAVILGGIIALIIQALDNNAHNQRH